MRFMPKVRLRARVPLRWTATNFSVALSTPAAAAIASQVLVQETDYEFASTLEPSGAVLQRIRGSFTATPSGALAGAVLLALGIVVLKRDESPPVAALLNPTSTTSLTDDDWLFLKSWTWDVPIGNAPVCFDIDVKAKRRLKDHRVYIVLGCSGAATAVWTVQGLARALLAMKSSG